MPCALMEMVIVSHVGQPDHVRRPFSADVWAPPIHGLLRRLPDRYIVRPCPFLFWCLFRMDAVTGRDPGCCGGAERRPSNPLWQQPHWLLTSTLPTSRVHGLQQPYACGACLPSEHTRLLETYERLRIRYSAWFCPNLSMSPFRGFSSRRALSSLVCRRARRPRGSIIYQRAG